MSDRITRYVTRNFRWAGTIDRHGPAGVEEGETRGISIDGRILGVNTVICTLLAGETFRESSGDSHPATLCSSAVVPTLQPVHASGH